MLRQQGFGSRVISRQTGINHGTIAKWMKHIATPDRLVNGPIPIEDMLVEHSPHGRRNLRDRLIKSGKLINICAICRCEPIWNGLPLQLRLDHINGVNDDCREKNLRLLCPNCDSQTDTYCGRNRKLKRLAREAGFEPAMRTLEAPALGR